MLPDNLLNYCSTKVAEGTARPPGESVRERLRRRRLGASVIWQLVVYEFEKGGEP